MDNSWTNTSLNGNTTTVSQDHFLCGSFIENIIEKWLRNLGYGIVFIPGVLGNLLAILAFNNQPKMRTVPNLFITNLAIADFVVSLINVPLVAVHAHLTFWPFGSFMCKLIPFVQGVSLAASVGTMIAIAADRFKVIVHYELPKMSISHAKAVLVVIWILSCAVPAPLLKYSDTIEVQCKGERLTKCVEMWSDPMHLRAYTMVLFMVLYCLPVVLTSLLYGKIAHTFRNLPTAQKVSHQAQHRIVRMFVIVVTLFAVCWLPYHVVFLYLDYAQPQQTDLLIKIVLFCQWLIYANSACNPVIYTVFNTNYRRQFLRMLRLPHRRVYENSSSTDGRNLSLRSRNRKQRLGKRNSCPSRTDAVIGNPEDMAVHTRPKSRGLTM
ncbi:neuropeptide FF receptor 2 [Nematostella vectensis]|uniref:neuropeptide FF receptor 2 n=1 Tax=Nematostella vectensis TaxID=45351 RepID=UPI002077628D|nr:neuropeptide FF receptor 2 [Nematostella vectensis]